MLLKMILCYLKTDLISNLFIVTKYYIINGTYYNLFPILTNLYIEILLIDKYIYVYTHN